MHFRQCKTFIALIERLDYSSNWRLPIMTTFQRRLLLAFLLIALIIILRNTNIINYFNLSFFQRYSAYLIDFIEKNYLVAVIGYLAIMILLTIFFIPLTPLMNIAAGYFFGFFPGIFYTLIGSTIGTTVSFLIFRYLLKDMVQHYYGARLKYFNQEVKTHGAKYLLSLQLLPITPFAVIIILASLSEISLFTFMWTTLIGILPGVAVYAYTGKQLMTMTTISDIWSWQFISAFLLLTCLALLPLIVRYWQRKKNARS